MARVLEGLMGLAAGSGHLRRRPGPKDAALRRARVCYNHLAGDMGTQLFDSLTARGHLVMEDDDLRITAGGAGFMSNFGIDLDDLPRKRTPLCRECLNWSERRSHLAGSLGRAFLSRFEALSWARRDPKTRVVIFCRNGEREFGRLFG